MTAARWAGAVLLGLLNGGNLQPAQATTIDPPAPLIIPFGPGDSTLDGTALEVVDRLIVRALQCAEGGKLTLTLHHWPSTDKALLSRREAAIRGRIAALGLSMVVQRETVDLEATAAWPPDDKHKVVKHWFLAGSARAEDDFCFEDGGLTVRPSPRLLPWLAQLKTALQGQPFQAPLFWQRLNPNVRKTYLSPALARLAHEQAEAVDLSARQAFWWLVDEEARRMPPEIRHQWALYLWQSGTDADLQEIQRRLGIGSIDLDELVQRAPRLMWSKLPWPVVERRLMAPGLMARAGLDLMPVLASAYSRLGMTEAVAKRNEWVAWGRLVRSAGSARACFLSDAVYLLQPHRRNNPPPELQHLAAWAAGPAGFVENGPFSCDPTAQLLDMGAGCGDPRDSHPAVATAWLKAGLVLHPESVARALSPDGVWGDGKCQLEPAPLGPFPYRVRKH